MAFIMLKFLPSYFGESSFYQGWMLNFVKSNLIMVYDPLYVLLDLVC